MTNIFEKLLNIDVSAHVEKKGKFSYLSWPWAVAELRKVDPTASWEVMHFEDKDGRTSIPFMNTSFGVFVEVAVTVDGVTLSQIHPVLDNRNQPIDDPNGFQINTSIQRCLVKAIALHGLGLSIYAGEDLPINPPKESQPKAEPKQEDDDPPPIYDEMLLKIEGAKALKHLSSIWEKYNGWFKGTEKAQLILAKDVCKQQLLEELEGK